MKSYYSSVSNLSLFFLNWELLHAEFHGSSSEFHTGQKIWPPHMSLIVATVLAPKGILNGSDVYY